MDTPSLYGWSGNGVLERVYAALTAEGLTDTEVYSLDSTAVRYTLTRRGRKKMARRR